jgi:hypothetical protein
VAEDHLASFVMSIVIEEPGPDPDHSQLPRREGTTSLPPGQMTAPLLSEYCCGIYASRRIAEVCRERVDFMSIGARPASAPPITSWLAQLKEGNLSCSETDGAKSTVSDRLKFEVASTTAFSDHQTRNGRAPTSLSG